MKIDTQELYEDILSAHWQKLYQIKELVSTNKNNHPLRIKSINDREQELHSIVNKKLSMELLFQDELTTPEWYNDRIREHS